MNLLVHMSYVVFLDYLLFRYLYLFANRYDILNFHEAGFLPARYIISGLVVSALVYWLYLIPVTLLNRFVKGYRHPHWFPLWLATALLSSIHIASMVVGASLPPLTIPVTVALLLHLQLVHLLMFIIGDDTRRTPLRLLVPGVGAGLIFMLGWLFWIAYSFVVIPSLDADPQPIIGSQLERYALALLIGVLILLGLWFIRMSRLPFIPPDARLLPELSLTVNDLIIGFYSSWALFYLLIPVLHFLLRGYITAHSNLFPAFLLGILVPLGWSLLVMWVQVWLLHPDWRLRMPRPSFMQH